MQEARQEVQRLKVGSAYTDHGLIFATGTGSPLERMNVTRQYFKPLVKQVRERQVKEFREAGIEPDAHVLFPPIRLYDLRHSAATLRLANGDHVKIASEMLGHASTVLTLDTYSHVLPEMQAASAARLDALLFPDTAAVRG